jgi:Zn-finger nucleic acid-binding protein
MPILVCPNCNVEVSEITRNGVRIDVCSQCRGVWLDRGELEKLLGAVQQVEDESDRSWDDDDRERPERHRRKGKLSRIFEIFD